MAEQADWVGNFPPKKPFKDIRNTRDTVAEEKAVICKLIGEACNKVPEKVSQGSVNIVRDWRRAREAAMKKAGDRRASVSELTSALTSMQRFK